MEILDSNDSSKFMITAREGKKKVFYIDCNEATLDNFRCSCLKFECQGLPCCHILVVLISLGATIPQCCVLNRWTRNAKSSLDEPDRVNSMKQGRVNELVNLAKQVFQEASSEEIVRWKELLVNECKKKRTSNDMGGNEQQDNNLAEEAPPIHVQDPVQVMSKGAPKRMKSFLDKKRVRQCSECKGTDHDKRTCLKKRKT
ncbi:hypothetical protein ACP4OV_021428 [Aristida adscensionis]